MTEKQWLKSTDPRPMLELLGRVASDRQLRLYACACARRVWSLLVDERSRAAVEVAERFADKLADDGELSRALLAAAEVQYEIEREDAWLGAEVTANQAEQMAARVAVDAASPRGTFRHASASGDDPNAATDVAYCGAEAIEHATSGNAGWARNRERKALAGVMRDLFGNPFMSVRFLPSWRTDTVTALAKQIYASRDFGAIPILADALQDAGCSNEEILAHCRDPKATHVRGCWALDRVLNLS